MGGGGLWTERVCSWWIPEQPVTTGIALTRSLRSPGYPGSDTMRCVSSPLCDTPASRFSTVTSLFFPRLPFGSKSALWLLACSHYRANGEGHVRSKDPLRDREAGWGGGGGGSLSSQGSQRTDRMVYPAPPGQLRHGTRGVGNTLSHTTVWGYFLITTSIEKSRKFVGLNEHQCKQQAHTGLRNQVQVA